LPIPGDYSVTEDILNLSTHIYTFRKSDLEFAVPRLQQYPQ
jgi:hypothetical protein